MWCNVREISRGIGVAPSPDLVPTRHEDSTRTLHGLQLANDLGQHRHLRLRRVHLPESPPLLGQPVPVVRIRTHRQPAHASHSSGLMVDNGACHGFHTAVGPGFPSQKRLNERCTVS